MKAFLHFKSPRAYLDYLRNSRASIGKKTIKKRTRFMELTGMLLLVLVLQVKAASFGQKVTLSKKNASFTSILKEIRKQTGYFFIYNSEVLEKVRPVTVNFQNRELEDVLQELFKGQPFTYSIQDKIIAIKLKAASAAVASPKEVGAQVQTRTITGKVTSSEDNQPLPGITVLVKGTTVATSTDIDGKYSLNIPASAETLVFSAVGYQKKEVSITSAATIDIALAAEATEIEQIVVAYGTAQKRTLTNSVAKITSEDIQDRSITNINTALAGAAPGVQTNAGSGQPGEGPDVRIRGFGSMNLAMDPLYVVDGAPYEAPISNINADDIESISVLKDASSTALYGSRGANGVIIITTKKGSKTRSSLNVKLAEGVSGRALADYETVNAEQYFVLMWEGIRNENMKDKEWTPDNMLLAGTIASEKVASEEYLRNNPFNVPANQIVFPDGTFNPNAKLLYPDDLDWKKALKQTGRRRDYNVSYSGGNTNSDYFVSLGYLDEEGVLIGTDFERFSGRINVNMKPNKWLKSGVNLSANMSTQNYSNESSGINENPFLVDLMMGPIYPVHEHDPVTGEYILDGNGNKKYDMSDTRILYPGRNVVAETLLNQNNRKRYSITGRTYVGIDFLKNFNFTSNVSVTLNSLKQNVFDNPEVGDAKGMQGRVSRLNTFSTYINFNQLLTYSKSFGKHDINVLAGHESYSYNYDNNSMGASGMIVEGTNVLDNFTTITGLRSYETDYRTEGYLSRVEYNYDGRYSISASLRRDASSRFFEKNKWGNFWSAGVAWNIDREAFFRIDWVNFLKFRAAYGVAGNDAIDTYYGWPSLYDLGWNNGAEPGMLYSKVEKKDLTWETTKSLDAAIEFSLLKSRIGGTIEVYQRQTDNLLFDQNLPFTAGVPSWVINVGSIRNRGVELQLDFVPVKTKDFRWDATLNVSTLENSIQKLPPGYDGFVNGTKKWEVGGSRYDFWTRDWYGIDPTTGSNLYWADMDLIRSSGSTNWKLAENGDTVTTASGNARFGYFGSAIPDYYGSIRNTFTYKNFSLNFLIQYQLGGVIIDSDYQDLMTTGFYGRAVHVDMLNRWQKPGDVTGIPARSVANSTMSASDRFLDDATYLNIKTATLAYNVTKAFASKLKMQNAKVYLSGENLFIKSIRPGLDPTQTYTGAPSYTYDPSRTVTLGLNVSF
ncbi:TonB-dependent receptor [Rufibacter ruber]|uniref:TonB-dependent receptor n=1 Tax=Rufibacter ruber TaxID=1783499 RepID=UPI0009EE7DF5|nr:TonB-dependent receptor [Rufibacter ruber]